MTHLDALCHDSDNGKLYNGYPLKETVDEDRGCTRLGLDNLKEGIVTRGILDGHDAPEECRWPTARRAGVL
jgi:hypothetical protein